MMRKIVFVFVAILFALSSNAQETLKRNQVIKRSVKVKRAVYAIDAYDSMSRPAIIIEGNNIVVDFNHSVLKGSNGKNRPDEYFGTAIVIRNGKNITIKNLDVRGYRVAVKAIGIEGLKIENCDFSYNYRGRVTVSYNPQLPGGFFAKDEYDDWLHYGAAIYLKYCNNAEIKNCKASGCDNALLLKQCDNGQFYNNDFSFNPGLGIGMLQCSNNKFLYNKLNFNVSHFGTPLESKLQYSAGIRMLPGSNNNTFYKNSVTHCGDGFIYETIGLPADLGPVLPDGNRLWANDFSYAADCGIETSFTGMHVADNRIFECRNGYFGENVYYTTIANNKFRDNETAVIIINGQQNQLTGNIFFRDHEAIRLLTIPRMSDPLHLPGTSKSAGYTIYLNSFNQNPVAYHFNNVDSIKIFNNRYSFVEQLFQVDSTVTNIDSIPFEAVDTMTVFPVVDNPVDPFKGNGRLAGRDKIMITEWGPYNFQYPFIWNNNPSDSSGFMNFDVLGPKGKWKIVSTKGGEVTGMSADSFPSKISVQVLGKPEDVELILEYTGPAFTDQFGNKVPTNKPYRFSFGKKA